MPQPRTCPNCSTVIPLETGFHFDENLNLICDKCDKIAVAAVDNDPVRVVNQYQPYQSTPTNRAAFEER